MSFASAKQLFIDMLENPDLAKELAAEPTPEGRWKLLESKGYEFTEQEWREVNEVALQSARGTKKGELDDKQLDAVSGGTGFMNELSRPAQERFLNFAQVPSIQMMYGMVSPAGGGV